MYVVDLHVCRVAVYFNFIFELWTNLFVLRSSTVLYSNSIMLVEICYTQINRSLSADRSDSDMSPIADLSCGKSIHYIKQATSGAALHRPHALLWCLHFFLNLYLFLIQKFFGWLNKIMKANINICLIFHNPCVNIRVILEIKSFA